MALWSLNTLSVPKSLASKRMTNSPPPGHSRLWNAVEPILILWQLACDCSVICLCFLQHYLEAFKQNGTRKLQEIWLEVGSWSDRFTFKSLIWSVQSSVGFVTDCLELCGLGLDRNLGNTTYRQRSACFRIVIWQCFYQEIPRHQTLGINTIARKGRIFVLRPVSHIRARNFMATCWQICKHALVT